MADRFPKKYKNGVLKKAKLQFKMNEIDTSFKTLFEGFNLETIYAHYEPENYKCWVVRFPNDVINNRFKNIKSSEKERMRVKFADQEKRCPYVHEFIKIICNETMFKKNDHAARPAIFKEQIQEISDLYDDVWEFLQVHLKLKKDEYKDKQFKKENRDKLKKVRGYIKEQQEPGFEYAPDEFNPDIKDFRKIYKTIMCPLKEKCGKAKYQRWPSSNLKSNSKFGKDCPYAHHPMELEFPQTLESRYNASKWKKPITKPHMTISGPLFDCAGC